MSEIAALAPATVEAPFAPRRRGAAFGRRFFVLLLVGMVFLGPAFIEPRFGWAIVAWDILLFACWWVDWRRLPPPSAITARRIWREPAAIGSELEAELELRNDSGVPLLAQVIDDLPGELRQQPVELEARIAARTEVRLPYRVFPICRGDIAIGNCFLRYQSMLQLAERWAIAQLAQTIRVYPDLKHAQRHSIYLQRSRQIEMEKRLHRFRGLGREFDSLREYRSGDELRDVCWTATARRGKLVTKLYQMERSQAVWIVLDCGRLMRARVGSLSKLDHATTSALSLAQVALYSGDRVGVLGYGRKIQQRVLPGRGRPHLRAILEALASARAETSEADHLFAAGALLAAQRRRSLVVWITDLAETAMTPEVVDAASELLPQHLVLFVVVGQPDLLQVAGSEPDTVKEMFQLTAAQEVVHRREVLLARLKERGALAIEVSSGEVSAALVNSYLEVKAKNRL